MADSLARRSFSQMWSMLDIRLSSSDIALLDAFPGLSHCSRIHSDRRQPVAGGSHDHSAAASDCVGQSICRLKSLYSVLVVHHKAASQALERPPAVSFRLVDSGQGGAVIGHMDMFQVSRSQSNAVEYIRSSRSVHRSCSSMGLASALDISGNRDARLRK